MKKRVMFYCQHVLGMGHLVRSLEIVKALNEFSVTFVNGGELLQGFQAPPSVEVVNLPAIKSDGEFENLHVAETGHGDLSDRFLCYPVGVSGSDLRRPDSGAVVADTTSAIEHLTVT